MSETLKVVQGKLEECEERYQKLAVEKSSLQGMLFNADEVRVSLDDKIKEVCCVHTVRLAKFVKMNITIIIGLAFY